MVVKVPIIHLYLLALQNKIQSLLIAGAHEMVRVFYFLLLKLINKYHGFKAIAYKT